jgi:hypothetical protein
LKLRKIQFENGHWEVVVFDHSENSVVEFFASKNLNEKTNRDFPFDITFESPKYDEVMSIVLQKEDDIDNWLAHKKAITSFTI